MIPKTTIPVAMPIMRIWLNKAHSAETSGDWANAAGKLRSDTTATSASALSMKFAACNRTNNQHARFFVAANLDFRYLGLDVHPRRQNSFRRGTSSLQN